MIPILYEHNETAFTSNGLGRLPDCVSCTVIEERNGVFEVELVYPITGLHYADLQEGRIICATHDEQKDLQPFEIYARTAPINGLVTFYAHHISYRLSDIICQPVDGASVSAVFSEISAKSMSTNPFTFWTDNTTGGNLDIIEPRSVRAILGGQQGSILDVFGGEYEFDKFLVKNYAHRGTNNGVTIRYGKNLLDLTQDYSTLSVYNAIVPYWASMDGTVVYGGIVSQAGSSEIIARAVDYSQDFPQTQPTIAQLEAKAASDLASKQPWTPSENIAIDFVALWQTEEYKYIANLERVQLCDTVTVIYTALGVQATAKVIRVEWDALNDRYSKIVLGDAKSSFAETVIKPVEQQLAQMPTTSMMQAAIDHATELITGGLGSHFVISQTGSDPGEILFMDTTDPATAVHVLRINVNGIGFSSSGVNGPYTSAWTLDGQFVADFITAGTMSANRIHGGTLTLGGQNNGNGTMELYDASTNKLVELTMDGMTMHTNNGYDVLYPINETTATVITNDPLTTENGGRVPVVIKVTETGQPSDPNAYKFGVNFLYMKDHYVNEPTESAYMMLTPNQFYMITRENASQQIDAPGSLYTFGEYGGVTMATDKIIKMGGKDGFRIGKLSTYDRSLTSLSNYSTGMDFEASAVTLKGSTTVWGNFTVSGTKNRLVKTENYRDRLLSCYEMPAPMFGDIGEGVTDEEGICFIDIDDVFSETVNTGIEYQVFLQKEGPGDVWVSEKHQNYFVIEGTPGVKFAWEIKAKQRGYEFERLEHLPDAEDEPDDLEHIYDMELEELIHSQEGVLYETA